MIAWAPCYRDDPRDHPQSTQGELDALPPHAGCRGKRRGAVGSARAAHVTGHAGLLLLRLDALTSSSQCAAAMRPLEGKATRTPRPAMAVPMQRLAEARRKHMRTRGTSRCWSCTALRSHALVPGVEALSWQEFVSVRLV